MHLGIRTRQRGSALLLGSALLALGAACSSSSNNNKTNNNAANSQVTAVSTIAATARPSTPAPVATAARTATPSAVVTSAARTPTPAAAATRAATSGASSAAVSATPLAADQNALEAAALKDTDFPSGFSSAGAPERNLTLGGQTASYAATYTKIAQGGSAGISVQAIIDGLTLFKDTATAQTSFKDLQSSITAQAGADITFEPITNGPKLGDDTLSFKVSGQTSGLDIAGYAIIWRHGRAGAAMIQVGVPAPASINDVLPLAQKQDANLNAIK